MAHEFTEKDYKLMRRLSMRFSYLRGFKYDLREDAVHYAVICALRMAEYHDDSISPFDAVIVGYTWRWTMKFYMNLTKAWRLDAAKVNVLFSDSPPEYLCSDSSLQKLIMKETKAIAQLYASESCQTILDLIEEGWGVVEIALKLGKSKQAVSYALRSVGRRVKDVVGA